MNSKASNKVNKIFKLDDGEDWWIVATDEADARQIGKSMDIGIDDDFDDDELTVEEMKMDDILAIGLVDGYDPSERYLYPEEPRKDSDNGRWYVTATIKQWLTVHKHGDVVASSVY